MVPENYYRLFNILAESSCNLLMSLCTSQGSSGVIVTKSIVNVSHYMIPFSKPPEMCSHTRHLQHALMSSNISFDKNATECKNNNDKSFVLNSRVICLLIIRV